MLLAALLGSGSISSHPRRRQYGGTAHCPPRFHPQRRSRTLRNVEFSTTGPTVRSPQTALVLSVTQDHLDYHATREEYVAAKRNIVAHQHPEDLLISNADCPTAQTFKDYSRHSTGLSAQRAPSKRARGARTSVYGCGYRMRLRLRSAIEHIYLYPAHTTSRMPVLPLPLPLHSASNRLPLLKPFPVFAAFRTGSSTSGNRPE